MSTLKSISIFSALIFSCLSAYCSISVTGSVTQYGSPVRFQSVFVKGSGVDTATVTNSNGSYQLSVNPTMGEGVLVLFTLNCLGDTQKVFKEYYHSTRSTVVNFNLCSSIQATNVKGFVSYQSKPLANVKVRFGLNSPFEYRDSVITDSNGFYIKTISTPLNASGLIYASVETCDGQEVQRSAFYNLEDTAEFNFDYCPGGKFKILSGRVINDALKMHKNDFNLLLYQYNTETLQLDLIDKQASDYLGSFRFFLQRAGRYIIKVVPKLGVLAKPTYYGGTHYWNEADIIDFGNDTISIVDIPVQSLSALTGNNWILGRLNDYRSPPLNQHTIYLQNDANEIIGFTNSLKDYFEFKNVPNGNYTLYTDVVGLPTTAPTIDLDKNYSDLNVIVNRKEVTYELPVASTISYSENPDNKSVVAYPVPMSTVLNITSQNDQTLQIEVVDISGKLLHEATLLPKFTSTIQTALWDRGIYIVKSYSSKGLINSFKVIK